MIEKFEVRGELDEFTLEVYNAPQVISVTPRRSIPQGEFEIKQSPTYKEEEQKKLFKRNDKIHIQIYFYDDVNKANTFHCKFIWVERKNLINDNAPEGWKIVFPENSEHYDYYLDFLLQEEDLIK